MDFVETHDPFGYVGARVMRRAPRSGRRRQRKSSSMKPDPGALAADHVDGDDEADGTARENGMILHGWLTRYDSRLDVYSLFMPNGGGVTLFSRDDIMKFISNPEFVLEKEDDDAFPPPLEDTTSRFVGAPMRKAATPANGTRKGKRRTRRSLDGGSDLDASEWVDGRVVCYHPFADRYRVEYDDESTSDVTESEIVDALLAFAKRTVEDAKKSSNESPSANEEVVSRKRRRSQDFAQPAEDDEETEDEEPPVTNDTMKVENEREPSSSISVNHGSSDRTDSVTTAATSSTSSANASTTPTEPEFESTAPVEDDEPMELAPLDVDDDEEDMNQVNAAMSTLATSTIQPEPPASPEVISLVDDASTTSPQESVQTSVPVSAAPRPVCYVVQERSHAATPPLEKRALAFEFLRAELTRLLDAEECAKLETALVADVMANRDIKDRDAVRRFVETGGLVVLNTLLNARGRDALVRPQARYDRVLFLLKLLAMVPTPSEQQVMESGIGKTVGRLIKSRMSDQQSAPDAAMPKCIAHLAKWIKHKWISTMRREKPPASASATKKHMQRPTHGRPSGPRSHDPTPIPRRPMSPSLPSIGSFTDQAKKKSVDVLGSALSSQPLPPKSSLKPDWMRQKETLTRTRFTINTDANAERQHYQRDRSNAVTRLQGPRTPDDPGPRGVYGRVQRLSFGPRWNVCEFFKDTPPTAVRRLSTPRTNSWTPKPRSILRKTSKYRDNLSF